MNDNHKRNGKFRKGNGAALRSPEQGNLNCRIELFHSAQQHALWSQAFDLASTRQTTKRPLRLQDWIRSTLDAVARTARRQQGWMSEIAPQAGATTIDAYPAGPANGGVSTPTPTPIRPA